jgi:hypothetical protein
MMISGSVLQPVNGMQSSRRTADSKSTKENCFFKARFPPIRLIVLQFTTVLCGLQFKDENRPARGIVKKRGDSPRFHSFPAQPTLIYFL